jgi:hypothetical protein
MTGCISYQQRFRCLEAMDGNSPEIFLSYKSERRRAAEHLTEILRRYGYTVWFDYQLLKGRDFGYQIDTKIRAAKALIVLWCAMSVRSEWVREEVDLAGALGLLIPVKIEDCELPVGSRLKDYVNLIDWDGSPRSHQLDPLFDAIAQKVGREPALNFRSLQEYEATWRRFGAPTLKSFALDQALEAGFGSRPLPQATISPAPAPQTTSSPAPSRQARMFPAPVPPATSSPPRAPQARVFPAPAPQTRIAPAPASQALQSVPALTTNELASLWRTNINLAFPSARAIAKKLARDGLQMKEPDDWFGPIDPGKWVVLVGDRVDVRVAQRVIAACAEHSAIDGWDLYAKIKREDDNLGQRNRIYIGTIDQPRFPKAPLADIDRVLRQGLTPAEFHGLIPA